MSELSKYFGNEGFEAPEDDGFDGTYALMPAGWYPSVISGVEIKDNSKGSGVRFIVEFTIVGEKFANRKVWNDAGFNFIHESEQCQTIGRSQLGRMIKACGYDENYRLKDENEVVGKTLDIYVEVKPANKHQTNPKDNNIATKFALIGAGGKDAPKAAATPVQHQVADTAPQQQTALPESAPAPAAAGKRPWEK